MNTYYRIKRSDLVLCPFLQYMNFDKLSDFNMDKVIHSSIVKDVTDPFRSQVAVLAVAENVQFCGDSEVMPVILVPFEEVEYKLYVKPSDIPFEMTSPTPTKKGFVAIYLD